MKKEIFEVDSQDIKNLIGIQVTIMLEIKLRKYSF